MAAFCGGGGAGLVVRVPVALAAGTGVAVRGWSASGGGAGAGVGSWARALAVVARGLLCVVWVCVCVFGCVVAGSGVIKPAELALLTALGSGGQGGGWRFGGGGGVCWRGERPRLLRLRRAGVSADPLCPMSACLLPGRLPNSHATVIAYGATVPRFLPLHLALLLLALWWLAIWSL